MKILLIGNLLFIPMQLSTTFVSDASPKYMAASIIGALFPSEIYTLTEIQEKYKSENLKEIDGFTQIGAVWGNIF